MRDEHVTTSSISVTSDVRRDILQTASIFSTDAKVVWEYIVNSLQYVDPGVVPHVQVSVWPRKKEVQISDNGRGMSAAELNNYFRMHGENIDRKEGRMGRGKFGTGKSAAFGIADTLIVDTRKDGIRNVVRLTRGQIEASAGDSIPLEQMVVNGPTKETNGTTITIADIQLQRISAARIIESAERNLQSFRHLSPRVAVNDHVCSYSSPVVDEEHSFVPTPAQAKIIGDVVLVVKVAPAPLSDHDQGIMVTAGEGNLIARETGGIEAKEYGNYLFGEVDVPLLESTEGSIEPYDATRSLALNPQHSVVGTLQGFIGANLDKVRRDLLRRAREARKNAENKRLAEQADKIAEILNNDFETIRKRLDEIRTASSAPGRVSSDFGDARSGDNSEDEWIEGDQLPGELNRTDPGQAGNGTGREAPTVTRRGTPGPDGGQSVSRAGGEGRQVSKPRGGFQVAYRGSGDEHRSLFDQNTLTIIINTEHPVVKAALENTGIEDPVFKRLSYEIAFSEYAIALGYQLIKQDSYMEADDVLYEVRDTLNRVSRAAAFLYRAD